MLLSLEDESAVQDLRYPDLLQSVQILLSLITKHAAGLKVASSMQATSGVSVAEPRG